MKLNYWLTLGVMVAVTATAQNSTNSLPSIPPPANSSAMVAPAPMLAVPAQVSTNAPAKKTVKKKKKAAKAKVATAKKSEKADKTVLAEPTAALVAGPAEVVVNNVNVRGQAGLKGEVVTHLQKDDSVTVISEITLDKHKADEPAQWAKISLPTNLTVWVNSKFIDATTKTVSSKKLNLRAGPGENYSVLGVIERGAAITESGAKGDWTKIEAPTNAYAFVAAMYLKQEESGNLPVNPAPSTETPVPAPTPTTVADTQPIIATPAPAPVPEPPAQVVQAPTVIIQTNIVEVPEVDTNLPPPPPRIVTHEGNVRNSVSIVAPTYFELYSPSDNKAINYLYSTTTNLNLARYNGLHIIVTGEEGLDARWRSTPVLTVQKIYVVSSNGVSSTLPDVTPAPADTQKYSPSHKFGR